MSGLDKNRVRNQTICFRVTPEERKQLEARIIASGLPKGEYYIRSFLHQSIRIAVGKYQSDRLSVEVKKLRERLDTLEPESEKCCECLEEIKALMEQMISLITVSKKEQINREDFGTAEQEKTISYGREDDENGINL